MKTIALSFSGGGFRAAAYSLGCLSYLHKIGLLQNVKFISSTSGGSITNLLYSSFIFQGKSFADFYAYTSAQLEGEQLLEEALRIFESSKIWKAHPDKSRNFINAFSIAYDKLLQQKTFSLFSDLSNNPHLEQICINATDFTNGLVFRFQSQNPQKNYPNGLIGNRFINVRETQIGIAAQLKLSDILAASSCFPSGFEPLIFPDDFSNANVTKQQLVESLSFKANEFTIENNYNKLDILNNPDFKNKIQFGLMDGGITDNQGIDAFVKADERRKRAESLSPFDLYISCDVTSHYMDGFTLPKKKWNILNWLSINTLIILLISGALILPALKIFHPGSWNFLIYVLASYSVLCISTLLFLTYKLIRSISKKSKPSAWSSVFKKHKQVFMRMNLGELKFLLATRAKSVLIMAEEIYLKQIRRMYYDFMRSDKRFIKNTIYDLSKTNYELNPTSNDDILYPSTQMIETAEKARTMGTTLWFDAVHTAENRKNCIIATGQFTTCFNLIRYFQKLPAESKTDEIIALEKNLLTDYESFKKDAFYML